MTDGACVAVVTGPSRGIGRATALALAKRGISLCLVGRPGVDIETARKSCEEAGAPSVTIVLAELSDVDAVERAAQKLALGAVVPEIIVHNAGVIRREPVEDLSLTSWQEQLDVNLTAPFLLTRALLPRMRARGRGRILFVGSISSTLGGARQSAYCASKWGVLGFMKSLAEEISDSGLMTAAVLPGSVDTRMLDGSGFPKRMSADDVARTLTFLALDAPLSHNGAAVEMFGV